jgi:hypothetical protein
MTTTRRVATVWLLTTLLGAAACGAASPGAQYASDRPARPVLVSGTPSSSSSSHAGEGGVTPEGSAECTTAADCVVLTICCVPVALPISALKGGINDCAVECPKAEIEKAAAHWPACNAGACTLR